MTKALELQRGQYPGGGEYVSVYAHGQQIGSLTKDVEGYRVAAFNSQPAGMLFPSLRSAVHYLLRAEIVRHEKIVSGLMRLVENECDSLGENI